MLEFSLFLKLGTTGLVLSLFESGKLPKYILEDSVKTMHALSRSKDFHAKILALRIGNRGKLQRVSPLSLHSHLCELSHRQLRQLAFESEYSEYEAFLINDAWNETITALARKDKEWPIGRIDYATKEFLAEHAITSGAYNLSPEKIRERVNLFYHELGAGTQYEKLKARGQAVRVVHDNEIAHAVEFPPSDTRAFVRGGFVAREIQNNNGMIHYIGWQEISVEDKAVSGNIKKFTLGDPFEYDPPWLSQILTE